MPGDPHPASAPPPARWWRREGERVVCELCPRECRVKPGQRAYCFSRVGAEDGILLGDYGRSSGFCLDPMESTPLHHFLPGSRILAFGTAGCNLGCRYCHNWDIARATEVTRLLDEASPEQIAHAARRLRCEAVAMTFNDPVMWAEYALDVAAAARAAGLASVVKTAGYISDRARAEFFAGMDAASVDLKGFSEDFYRRVVGGHLRPVLDTLEHLARETSIWLEVVVLLIPGENDDEAEIRQLCAWIRERLGERIPLHFTAFTPDYRMKGRPSAPEDLTRARRIARDEGLRHVYAPGLPGGEGQVTWCAACGEPLIRRENFSITSWTLGAFGACPRCGERLGGRLHDQPGEGVERRFGVRLGAIR